LVSFSLRTYRCLAFVLEWLRVTGGVLIFLGALVASKLRFGVWIPPAELWFFTAGGPIIYLVYMQLSDGYKYFRPNQGMIGIRRLLCGLGAAFGILLLLAYFSKISSDISRLWTGYWIVINVLILILSRLWIAGWLRYSGSAELLDSQVVVLASYSEESAFFINLIEKGGQKESLKVSRVFCASEDNQKVLKGALFSGEKLEALLSYIRSNPVEFLILSLNEQDQANLDDVMDALEELSITILEAPAGPLAETYHKVADWVILAGFPMRRVSIQPLDSQAWILKTIEVYVLGSICLAIAAPLMALIAIAIKLDSSGPVFFFQKRHGFNGQEIEVYKFRSMIYGGAEEAVFQQATKNDQRVTKLGRFLRRSSLDELPQLINVMKGELCLAGPRPHPVELNKSFHNKINAYLSRHRVKPGITGWAQVNGWRGATDTDEKMTERVRHDIYYINNWSLMLDLKILFMTLFVGFVGKNAY